ETKFHADHFFDGYKSNPAYAPDRLREAQRAGARWLVLYVTHGGTMPCDGERIVGKVTEPIPGSQLGNSAHCDTAAADASRLAPVEQVKTREYEGYAYDGAEASFELLARRALGRIGDYFRLVRFRVMDDRRWNARGDLVTESEATVTIEVGDQHLMTVATGNG